MPLVTRYPDGTPGPTGPPGPAGPAGAGVPDGGTTGQVLAKASNANQDTHWVAGGGSQTVTVLKFPFDHATVWSEYLLHTLADGDLLIGYWFSLPTAFDGSTPQLSMGYPGTPGGIFTAGIGAPDTNNGNNFFTNIYPFGNGNPSFSASGGTTPLTATLAAGGSAAGSGVLYLMVATPTA